MAGGSGSAVSSARPGLLDERMGAPPAHRRFESQAVIESARRVGGEQQQSHPQRRGAEHCHRQSATHAAAAAAPAPRDLN